MAGPTALALAPLGENRRTDTDRKGQTPFLGLPPNPANFSDPKRGTEAPMPRVRLMALKKITALLIPEDRYGAHSRPSSDSRINLQFKQ